MDNTLPWKSVIEAYKHAKKQILGRKTKKGLSEARVAFTYCAQENDSKAQYQLYAMEYENARRSGGGELLDWLRKSAESGYAPAQYDLGLHYLYGEYVEKDLLVALTLIEQAGYQGYKEACRLLGRLYTVGTLVKKNDVRAEYWKSRYEGDSWAETHSLLELTPESIVPEIKVKRTQEEIDRQKRAVLSFDKLFKKVDQSYVIEAPSEKSFIINAGPGTGKTYVMIRKINNLIKQGVEPKEILVLSFTNAVVKEVKNRLSDLASDIEGTNGLGLVEVRTFHSFAFKMLKIANEAEGLDDWEQINLDFSRLTFDDCMVKGSYMLEKYGDVLKYLNNGQGYKYILVDEIQDINHGKAKFVINILKSCIQCEIPFLFLGDSCQAIYDYLDERTSVEVKVTSEEFYKTILDLSSGKSETVSFDINHRSASKVQEQSEPIRKALLEEKVEDYPVLVIDYEKALAKASIDSISGFLRTNKDSKICLMERSNVATRHLSKLLIEAGIEHRCILSVHKGLYPAWLGILFSSYEEDYLTRESVNKLFVNHGYYLTQADELWKTLQVRNNFGEIIQFRHAMICMLSHDLDNCIHDEEEDFQITVSNIHRTKGLEYDYVMIDEKFMRPQHKTAEEMRVLYVAMTRAKKETYSLKDVKYPSFLKLRYSNRHYRMKKNGEGVQELKYIEIIAQEGKSDVAPECYVVPNVDESQSIIRSLKPNDEIILKYDESEGRYAIIAKNAVIGWMTEYFTNSVRYLSHSRLPRMFDEIYVDNIYTYLGTINARRPAYEERMKMYSKEYGKNCIWNYALFSGLAHAVYDN